MDQQEKLGDTDRTVLQIWAAFVAVLLAFSWKLWLPGFSDFPRVPIFDVHDGAWLSLLQYFGTTVLVVGLVGLASGVIKFRWAAVCVSAAFSILFCCNQHCLQPWAWQAFIIATLLASMPIDEARRWAARLLISIYLFSAIGKFDYQFVHTTGQEFLDVILGWTASVVRVDSLSDALRAKLVLLFPVGELLIAVGLIFQPTRKLAAWLAIVLHVLLMLVLSPVGLSHRWPVVIWNGMSILLVYWLFLSNAQSTDATGRRQANERVGTVQRLGVVFSMVVLFGPLLRPVQYWDHWLAWGLYSPSNSRVELLVSDVARDRIDVLLQPYFVESQKMPGSSRFAMDRWSLDELGVPIYPQARFQKSAVLRWLRANDMQGLAKLIEYGPSHPMTGRRSSSAVALPEN
ncbi:hypothetical protein [Mariniblastus fucicola]|uniref:Vitamin K-dependent gamma-carboxylase n=1 Tax=Mariniblastus fucicola TaxID=980251 RepID=A0A5B9PEN8_9BACT|nr:hypothetical protein [Mariniblastus fucicola]QEG23630.1 hypothetical protein MFFC18_35310 [Mariniblastus fucicola]